MSLRLRVRVGPFVADAPLTKKPTRQGALSRRETLWLLGCLALAVSPCVIVWFL